MIYTVTEEGGINELEQLAGSSSTGTPLGTWASFENDYAPNIEWLQGGTTFNPNTYPALAMYLGGNTVPERFDHDRPSDLENITLQTTNQVALYDGLIVFPWYNATGNFYVNENIIEKASSSNSITNLAIPIKKGDTYRVSNLNNIGANTVFAQWYKHPLFIKATPTSADSDYEGTLNGIRTYVSNSNSYSTTETLTGGKWIDGKPIYRRVSTATGSASGWGNILVNDFNAQTILKCLVIESGNFTSIPSYVTTNQSGYIRCYFPSGGTSVGATVVLEYTKSTD